MPVETMIMMLLLLSLLPLFGLFLAVVPQLTRRGECFSVTVPEVAWSDPRIKAVRKRYVVVMICATALLSVLSLFFLSVSVERTGLLLIICFFVLLILSFLAMLDGRKRVRAIKEESGWHAASEVRTVVIAEGDIPAAVSLGWEVLNLPVIVLTLAIGVLGYGLIPAQVPLHVDLSGQVTSWMGKTPALVLFPVLIQFFCTLCFAFSHWGIVHSKRPIDADAPVSTAYAYGLFARAQSIYLVVFGVILNLSFVSFSLMMIGILSIMQAAIAVVLVALIAVMGSIIMAFVYGQGGARIIRRMQESQTISFDDDEHWKLGTFYGNRDDPSLFVPKRFGIGWTSNFGRPATWVIVVVFTLVTVLFVVAMLLIF